MSQAAIAAATGRRKTAVARVELFEGAGDITINGRPLEDYFPTVALQNNVTLPLQVANCRQQYAIRIRTRGGGVNGQVGAIRHGLSRALILAEAERRPDLKARGLLTRDPRMKERKKAGQPGARKRFQFSKR